MNGLSILYVAFGGAFGAMMRYIATDLIARYNQSGFPVGTLAVNVLGCFLMGAWLASVLVMPNVARAKDLHLLLAVGALGGFTTFSAFSFDAFQLAERGLYTQAALYMGGSVVLSIAALLLGMSVVKWVAA